MRRIFDAITNNSGKGSSTPKASEDVSSPTNSSSQENQKKNASPKSASFRSRGFLNRASKLESKFANAEDAKSLSLILASAQRLNKAIDEILNDASGLAGDNMAGFERLIEILDADAVDESSTGSLTILIEYRNHPKFIESCNSYDLANSLFNVLRLLRMYEIKQAKLAQSLQSILTARTIHTMTRVMSVFSKLLENSQTVEHLRPSLVKLFVFPLSALPVNALHFQQLSSDLISLICKAGLSSQIVWFLHDQQAMHHMTRQLAELTSLDYISTSDARINEVTLRGREGEEAGMWVIALRCVVEVINASVSVSPVLMVDFERAGGYKVIVHVIENCSKAHSVDAMNITMRLFFDPNLKSDEPLSFPDIGVILSDILTSCIGLKRRINDDDGLEKLIAISQHLQLQNNISGREFILQSFSYALLNVYSNDPRNCNILEEHFHYLPTLVICLPALLQVDTISAILTTLNYVCQCVETAATIPLIALCAASTVSVTTAVALDADVQLVERSLTQFYIMFSSYDAIIRSNGKYAMVLANGGWLKHMICDQFAHLARCLEQQQSIRKSTYLTYEKLVLLLVCIDRKSPFVANEIFNCGILNVMNEILSSSMIPPAFMRKLLMIYESLSLSELKNQIYCVSLLTRKLNEFELNYPEKSLCLLEALREMILSSDSVTSVSFQNDAIGVLLRIVKLLKGTFVSNLVNSNPQQIDLYFFLLGSISKYFATMLSLTYPSIYQRDYDEKFQFYTRFYRAYAFYLWETGIFSCSKFNDTSLSLVLILIYGDVSRRRVEVPSSLIALFSLYPHLSNSLQKKAIKECDDVLKMLFQSSQILVENNVIGYLIENFFGCHLGDLPHFSAIVDVIQKHLATYLRPQDLVLYLRDIVRPSLIPRLSNRELLYKHLPPLSVGNHQSFEESRWWDYMRIFLPIDNFSRCVSYLTLGSLPLRKSRRPSFVSMILPESMCSFPSSAFTFSSWFQLPHTTSDLFSGMITILSLTTTPSSAQGCFIEIQLCCHNFEVLVIFRHGNHMSTLKFRPMISLQHSSWTLLTFAYKRGRKFPIVGRSIVNVFLNGIASESVEIEGLDSDIPITGNAKVEVVLGKSYIDTIEASSLSEEVPRWNLGPFIFFEEVLSQSQVGVLYMKGPSYCGNFQGVALSESGATISSYMLRECNFPTKSCDSYFDSIGFRGLENIVDPFSESKFDVATIPKPLLQFSAENIVYSSLRQAASSDEEKYADEYQTSIGENAMVRCSSVSLINSTNADGEIISASLHSNPSIVFSESFGSCVSSVGGPSILFPIVHYASTSEQLCQALKLMRQAIHSVTANIKYMKRSGYKTLAFLLSMKSTSILNVEVLNEIFEFTVDRSYDDCSPKNPTVLLADTSAMFYLLMNHQIWDAKRFSCMMKIIEHLILLVKDPRYGYLNASRLSSLGVAPWLMHLCMYGIQICSTQTLNAYDDRGPGSGAWYVKCGTDEELSYHNDDRDPFLQAVISLLLRIIAVDIKLRDLDLLSQLISLTFTPVVMKTNSTSLSAAHTSSKSTDRKSEIGSPFRNTRSMIPDSTSIASSQLFSIKPNRTSPYIQLRIYLIRLIYQLSEHNAFGSNILAGPKKTTPASNSLFTKAFRLEWILNLIEAASDYGSKTYGLRLLGLFIQIDQSFYIEFCSKRVTKVLEGILLSSNMNDGHLLPISLPLVGMAFKIPFQVLPYGFQVTSSDKLLQLCELEECKGPDCSDSEGVRFTLPFHSLLLSIVTHQRSSVIGWISESILPDNIVNDIILKFISYYLNKNVGYRQLMQNRYAAEIMTGSILMSSNAVDDYGSYIYRQSNTLESDDISILVHEDYIPSNEGLSLTTNIDTVRVSSEMSSPTKGSYRASASEKTVVLKGEGSQLLKLLSSMMDSALKEFNNFTIFSNLFLSFPSNMDESFTYGYQYLLFTEIKNLVDFMVAKNFGSKVMSTIANSFVMLIPLLKAQVLHERIQNELLKILLNLIDRFQEQRDSHQRLDELFSPIVREVILTARYIVSQLLFQISSSSMDISDREQLFIDILMTVRKNLLKLMPSGTDEATDPYFSSKSATKQNPFDDKSSIGILDSFQIVWSLETSTTTDKRFLSDLMSSCIAERLRVSNVFVSSLSISAINLLRLENLGIVIESLRILTLLSIHRKANMKQLFSPDIPSSGILSTGRTITRTTAESLTDDFIPYEDGLMNLLPQSSYCQLYVNFLAGLGSDSVGEEKRFADFNAWYASNASQLYKFIKPIENHIRTLIPTNIDSLNTIRQIQALRIRDRPSTFANLIATDSSRSMDFMSKSGYKLSLSLRSWKLRGLANLASGAVLWRQVYCSLQTGPIWGYLKVKDCPFAISEWTEEGILSSRNTSLKGLLSPIAGFRGAKLDSAEGPERMRRKLEQDYTNFQQKAWAQVIAETNNQINEKLSKSATQSPSDDDDVSMLPNKSLMIESRDDMKLPSFFTPMKSALSMMNKTPMWKNRSMNAAMLASHTKFSPDADQTPDLAEFVREMAKQGIIKRVDKQTEGSLYDNLETNIDTAAISSALDKRLFDSGDDGVLKQADSTDQTSDDITNSGVVDDESFSFDTTATEAESLIDTASANSRAIAADNGGVTVTAERVIKQSVDITKSMVIDEILKGLLGLQDWSQGEMFNIERINGLESSRGLMVITDAHIYLINGIALKRISPIEQLSTKGKSRELSPRNYNIDKSMKGEFSSSSNALRSFEWLLDQSNLSEILDEDSQLQWTSMLWDDLLSTDNSFSKSSFTEVKRSGTVLLLYELICWYVDLFGV
jgi:hypothetical protein